MFNSRDEIQLAFVQSGLPKEKQDAFFSGFVAGGEVMMSIIKEQLVIKQPEYVKEFPFSVQ